MTTTSKYVKLIEDIKNDPGLVDRLDERELQEIEHLLSPLGCVLESQKNDDRHICYSFVNHRKAFIEKLIMTAMSGYIYRKADEFGVSASDPVSNMDDMVLARKTVAKNRTRSLALEKELVDTIRLRRETETVAKEYELVNEKNIQICKSDDAVDKLTVEEIKVMKANAKLCAKTRGELRDIGKKIDRLRKEQTDIDSYAERYAVRKFLDSIFKYNVDQHIRSSYTKNTKGLPDSVCVPKFVPPDETFHNFEKYTTDNYEEIKAMTKLIYKNGVSDNLDVGFIFYDVFPNKTDADDFITRNQHNVIATITCSKFGLWNIVENYKANRDSTDAYRGTMVEEILKQVEADQKLGKELLRDRAVRRRTENIKATRPDPGIVRDYMKSKETTDIDHANLDEKQQEEIYKIHVATKRAEEDALLDEFDKTLDGRVDEKSADKKFVPTTNHTVLAGGVLNLDMSKAHRGDELPDTLEENPEPGSTGETELLEAMLRAQTTQEDQVVEDTPDDALRINVFKISDSGKTVSKSHGFTKRRAPAEGSFRVG